MSINYSVQCGLWLIIGCRLAHWHISELPYTYPSRNHCMELQSQKDPLKKKPGWALPRTWQNVMTACDIFLVIQSNKSLRIWLYAIHTFFLKKERGTESLVAFKEIFFFALMMYFQQSEHSVVIIAKSPRFFPLSYF